MFHFLQLVKVADAAMAWHKKIVIKMLLLQLIRIRRKMTKGVVATVYAKQSRQVRLSFSYPCEARPSSTDCFVGIGLLKYIFLGLSCVGRSCKRDDCNKYHDPFICMDPGDRTKILNKLVKMKASYCNPALKQNSRAIQLLTDNKSLSSL